MIQVKCRLKNCTGNCPLMIVYQLILNISHWLTICLFVSLLQVIDLVRVVHCCTSTCTSCSLLYKYMNKLFTAVQVHVQVVHCCTSTCTSCSLLYKYMYKLFTVVQVHVQVVHCCTSTCTSCSLLFKYMNKLFTAVQVHEQSCSLLYKYMNKLFTAVQVHEQVVHCCTST